NTNSVFWEDFDFSAYNAGSDVKFVGVSDMSNVIGGSAFPLSNPMYRFGHSPLTGLSTEYVGTGASLTFIGRFTMGETSHTGFGYPASTASLPFTNYASLAVNANGVVSNSSVTWNGPRRGEDILLTNVHSFDIKIFDDYNEDRNNNGTLDPATATLALEDTNGNGV